MDLMVKREAVAINDTVYDGCVQQQMDCDITLPDYCPDILALLRCELTSYVTSRQVVGDKLNIEGTAVIRIIYRSEDGCMRSHMHKLPFSKVIELKCAPESPMISVTVSTDYVNCRPVSQRRLDIRSSLTIAAVVTVQRAEQIVGELSGMCVETRRKVLELSQPIALAVRSFTMREELELTYGKASVGSIIRCDCSCMVQDYKLIAGKAIVKGEMLLHMLYTTGESESDILDYSLPLSQIVDVDGIDENCMCRITMTAGEVSIEPKSNMEGEMRLLSVSVDISCMVHAFRAIELPAIADMYSTRFESSFTQKQISVQKLCGIVTDTCQSKSTFEMPDDNVSCVLDVWSDVTVKSVRVENKELLVTGGIKSCMLVLCENGTISFYERSSELEYRSKLDFTAETMTAEGSAMVRATTYSMQGRDRIEIRCELCISASVYAVTRECVVCDVKVSETEQKKKTYDSALTLYFAEKDECIWDIAKSYNTSAGLITAQNNITYELLPERKMLLIPINE